MKKKQAKLARFCASRARFKDLAGRIWSVGRMLCLPELNELSFKGRLLMIPFCLEILFFKWSVYLDALI